MNEDLMNRSISQVRMSFVLHREQTHEQIHTVLTERSHLR